MAFVICSRNDTSARFSAPRVIHSDISLFFFADTGPRVHVTHWQVAGPCDCLNLPYHIILVWENQSERGVLQDQYHAHIMECRKIFVAPFSLGSLRVVDVIWSHRQPCEASGSSDVSGSNGSALMDPVMHGRKGTQTNPNIPLNIPKIERYGVSKYVVELPKV